MVIVVGLGNPGSVYAGTRHNIGFEIVDAVARTLGLDFRPGSGEFFWAECSRRETACLLVKPVAYMNNSGYVVREVAEARGVDAGRLLVVLDDFHLPLSSLRLRESGSAGGHNGLASVLRELETEIVPRLRFGIGGATMPENKQKFAQYVLSPFEESERAEVGDGILRSRDVVLDVIEHGVVRSMSRQQQRKT